MRSPGSRDKSVLSNTSIQTDATRILVGWVLEDYENESFFKKAGAQLRVDLAQLYPYLVKYDSKGIEGIIERICEGKGLDQTELNKAKEMARRIFCDIQMDRLAKFAASNNALSGLLVEHQDAIRDKLQATDKRVQVSDIDRFSPENLAERSRDPSRSNDLSIKKALLDIGISSEVATQQAIRIVNASKPTEAKEQQPKPAAAENREDKSSPLSILKQILSQPDASKKFGTMLKEIKGDDPVQEIFNKVTSQTILQSLTKEAIKLRILELISKPHSEAAILQAEALAKEFFAEIHYNRLRTSLDLDPEIQNSLDSAKIKENLRNAVDINEINAVIPSAVAARRATFESDSARRETTVPVTEALLVKIGIIVSDSSLASLQPANAKLRQAVLAKFVPKAADKKAEPTSPVAGTPATSNATARPTEAPAQPEVKQQPPKPTGIPVSAQTVRLDRVDVESVDRGREPSAVPVPQPIIRDKTLQVETGGGTQSQPELSAANESGTMLSGGKADGGGDIGVGKGGHEAEAKERKIRDKAPKKPLLPKGKTSEQELHALHGLQAYSPLAYLFLKGEGENEKNSLFSLVEVIDAKMLSSQLLLTDVLFKGEEAVQQRLRELRDPNRAILPCINFNEEDISKISGIIIAAAAVHRSKIESAAADAQTVWQYEPLKGGVRRHPAGRVSPQGNAGEIASDRKETPSAPEIKSGLMDTPILQLFQQIIAQKKFASVVARIEIKEAKTPEKALFEKLHTNLGKPLDQCSSEDLERAVETLFATEEIQDQAKEMGRTIFSELQYQRLIKFAENNPALQKLIAQHADKIKQQLKTTEEEPGFEGFIRVTVEDIDKFSPENISRQGNDKIAIAQLLQKIGIGSNFDKAEVFAEQIFKAQGVRPRDQADVPATSNAALAADPLLVELEKLKEEAQRLKNEARSDNPEFLQNQNEMLESVAQSFHDSQTGGPFVGFERVVLEKAVKLQDILFTIQHMNVPSTGEADHNIIRRDIEKLARPVIELADNIVRAKSAKYHSFISYYHALKEEQKHHDAIRDEESRARKAAEDADTPPVRPQENVTPAAVVEREQSSRATEEVDEFAELRGKFGEEQKIPEPTSTPRPQVSSAATTASNAASRQRSETKSEPITYAQFAQQFEPLLEEKIKFLALANEKQKKQEVLTLISRAEAERINAEKALKAFNAAKQSKQLDPNAHKHIQTIINANAIIQHVLLPQFDALVKQIRDSGFRTTYESHAKKILNGQKPSALSFLPGVKKTETIIGIREAVQALALGSDQAASPLKVYTTELETLRAWNANARIAAVPADVKKAGKTEPVPTSDSTKTAGARLPTQAPAAQASDVKIAASPAARLLPLAQVAGSKNIESLSQIIEKLNRDLDQIKQHVLNMKSKRDFDDNLLGVKTNLFKLFDVWKASNLIGVKEIFDLYNLVDKWRADQPIDYSAIDKFCNETFPAWIKIFSDEKTRKEAENAKKAGKTEPAPTSDPTKTASVRIPDRAQIPAAHASDVKIAVTPAAELTIEQLQNQLKQLAETLAHKKSKLLKTQQISAELQNLAHASEELRKSAATEQTEEKGKLHGIIDIAKAYIRINFELKPQADILQQKGKPEEQKAIALFASTPSSSEESQRAFLLERLSAIQDEIARYELLERAAVKVEQQGAEPAVLGREAQGIRPEVATAGNAQVDRPQPTNPPRSGTQPAVQQPELQAPATPLPQARATAHAATTSRPEANARTGTSPAKTSSRAPEAKLPLELSTEHTLVFEIKDFASAKIDKLIADLKWASDDLASLSEYDRKPTLQLLKDGLDKTIHVQLKPQNKTILLSEYISLYIQAFHINNEAALRSLFVKTINKAIEELAKLSKAKKQAEAAEKAEAERKKAESATPADPHQQQPQARASGQPAGEVKEQPPKPSPVADIKLDAQGHSPEDVATLAQLAGIAEKKANQLQKIPGLILQELNKLKQEVDELNKTANQASRDFDSCVKYGQDPSHHQSSVFYADTRIEVIIQEAEILSRRLQGREKAQAENLIKQMKLARREPESILENFGEQRPTKELRERIKKHVRESYKEAQRPAIDQQFQTYYSELLQTNVKSQNSELTKIEAEVPVLVQNLAILEQKASEADALLQEFRVINAKTKVNPTEREVDSKLPNGEYSDLTGEHIKVIRCLAQITKLQEEAKTAHEAVRKNIRVTGNISFKIADKHLKKITALYDEINKRNEKLKQDAAKFNPGWPAQATKYLHNLLAPADHKLSQAPAESAARSRDADRPLAPEVKLNVSPPTPTSSAGRHQDVPRAVPAESGTPRVDPKEAKQRQPLTEIPIPVDPNASLRQQRFNITRRRRGDASPTTRAADNKERTPLIPPEDAASQLDNQSPPSRQEAASGTRPRQNAPTGDTMQRSSTPVPQRVNQDELNNGSPRAQSAPQQQAAQRERPQESKRSAQKTEDPEYINNLLKELRELQKANKRKEKIDGTVFARITENIINPLIRIVEGVSEIERKEDFAEYVKELGAFREQAIALLNQLKSDTTPINYKDNFNNKNQRRTIEEAAEFIDKAYFKALQMKQEQGSDVEDTTTASLSPPLPNTAVSPNTPKPSRVSALTLPLNFSQNLDPQARDLAQTLPPYPPHLRAPGEHGAPSNISGSSGGRARLIKLRKNTDNSASDTEIDTRPRGTARPEDVHATLIEDKEQAPSPRSSSGFDSPASSRATVRAQTRLPGRGKIRRENKDLKTERTPTPLPSPRSDSSGSASFVAIKEEARQAIKKLRELNDAASQIAQAISSPPTRKQKAGSQAQAAPLSLEQGYAQIEAIRVEAEALKKVVSARNQKEAKKLYKEIEKNQKQIKAMLPATPESKEAKDSHHRHRPGKAKRQQHLRQSEDSGEEKESVQDVSDSDRAGGRPRKADSGSETPSSRGSGSNRSGSGSDSGSGSGSDSETDRELDDKEVDKSVTHVYGSLAEIIKNIEEVRADLDKAKAIEADINAKATLAFMRLRARDIEAAKGNMNLRDALPNKLAALRPLAHKIDEQLEKLEALYDKLDNFIKANQEAKGPEAKRGAHPDAKSAEFDVKGQIQEEFRFKFWNARKRGYVLKAVPDSKLAKNLEAASANAEQQDHFLYVAKNVLKVRDKLKEKIDILKEARGEYDAVRDLDRRLQKDTLTYSYKTNSEWRVQTITEYKDEKDFQTKLSAQARSLPHAPRALEAKGGFITPETKTKDLKLDAKKNSAATFIHTPAKADPNDPKDRSVITVGERIPLGKRTVAGAVQFQLSQNLDRVEVFTNAFMALNAAEKARFTIISPQSRDKVKEFFSKFTAYPANLKAIEKFLNNYISDYGNAAKALHKAYLEHICEPSKSVIWGTAYYLNHAFIDEAEKMVEAIAGMPKCKNKRLEIIGDSIEVRYAIKVYCKAKLKMMGPLPATATAAEKAEYNAEKIKYDYIPDSVTPEPSASDVAHAMNHLRAQQALGLVDDTKPSPPEKEKEAREKENKQFVGQYLSHIGRKKLAAKANTELDKIETKLDRSHIISDPDKKAARNMDLAFEDISHGASPPGSSSSASSRSAPADGKEEKKDDRSRRTLRNGSVPE